MKILCLRLSALGDVVLTTGVLAWVRKHHPEAQIDFVTATHLSPLLPKHLNLGQIHQLPKGSPRKDVAKFAKSLPPYDIILDWHGSLKSRRICRFLQGRVFRIKKQSLLRRLYVKFRFGKKALKQHVVEKYAQTCLEALDIPRANIEELRPTLETTASDNFSFLPPSFVAIHPFASQKNKLWPYFEDLCKTLDEQGHKLVVLGSDPDSGAWPGINLVNKTSLEEMSEILSKAQILVTTDSGPMHMAIAHRCPTLAIFGPTTKEFGFYPEFEKTMVLENPDVPCRPCHIHGGQICPQKHFRCMKSISVEQVLEGMKALGLPLHSKTLES